jgi:hypothetical protein
MYVEISLGTGVIRAYTDDFDMIMGLLSHKGRASREMLLANTSSVYDERDEVE